MKGHLLLPRKPGRQVSCDQRGTWGISGGLQGQPSNLRLGAPLLRDPELLQARCLHAFKDTGSSCTVAGIDLLTSLEADNIELVQTVIRGMGGHDDGDMPVSLLVPYFTGKECCLLGVFIAPWTQESGAKPFLLLRQLNTSDTYPCPLHLCQSLQDLSVSCQPQESPQIFLTVCLERGTRGSLISVVSVFIETRSQTRCSASGCSHTMPCPSASAGLHKIIVLPSWFLMPLFFKLGGPHHGISSSIRIP